MKLMGTNQRRSLRRRRKLMPDPRRDSAPVEVEQETRVLREAVATGTRSDVVTPPLEPVEQPDEDRVLVQS